MTEGDHNKRQGFAAQVDRTLRRARALQPVAVGETPADVVMETPHARLRRYGDAGDPPVLLIYSLVNRAYLLDLAPERSVIRHLRDSGFCVYLLDWRDPDAVSRFHSLEDHLECDIDAAVNHLEQTHGTAPHVAGVCQGGVLALAWAAWRPRRARTLTLLATPVDFTTPEDRLHRLARDIDFESLTHAWGNIPASALNTVFTALKPFQLFIARYTAMADIADHDDALIEFLRMERWMYDSPDQPGLAFMEFARTFYQQNALLERTLTLFGEARPAGNIETPVFAAWAEDDHLVPPAAARAIHALLPEADVTERRLPGGHLGLFVGRRAHRELYPALTRWWAAH